MSVRNNWKFGYKASDLAMQTRERVAYHRAHLDDWKHRLAAAEHDLREHGVEFREHQVTGGRQINAVLDPERQAHVTDCRNKIDWHRSELRAYSVFLLAFEQNGDTVLELDADDIRYFFAGEPKD